MSSVPTWMDECIPMGTSWKEAGVDQMRACIGEELLKKHEEDYFYVFASPINQEEGLGIFFHETWEMSTWAIKNKTGTHVRFVTPFNLQKTVPYLANYVP